MAGSDLYVGTLDGLILKAVSCGPMHGYAIGRWIGEQRVTLCVYKRARFTLRCTG